MKRAHLQRVKPVEYSPSQVEGSVEQQNQVVNGVKRKKRTSAAMIGLALSMGASSLLIPRQNEGATAAEPTSTDAATISMIPSASAAPAATTIEHVVLQGQTLWKLAQRYHVSVEAIAAVNSLKASDIVKVGQIIRIPTTAAEAHVPESPQFVELSTTRSPQQVASADLNSLPVVASQAKPETVKLEVAQAQRDISLDRLRQQQEKLRQSLADLKTKDQSAKAKVASSSEAIKPDPSAIASMPSSTRDYQNRSGEASSTVTLSNSGSAPDLLAASNVSAPDWLRTNQALTVTSTATSDLITQVPRSASTAPTVSTPVRIAQQPTVRSNVQQVAANPKPEMVSYQVNLGDTVAEIASAHNISPSTLVQANRISDPNFIFVGQILRVPATRVMASAPAPRAQQSAPAQQAAPRLSVVPTTATALVNPSPVVQPNLGIGGGLAAPSTSGRDPHVETLLSEIKVLRERHRVNPVAAATPNVPAPEAVQIAASTLPTPSVSTQFNPGGLNAVQAPQSLQVPQPTPLQASQPTTARSARSQTIPIRVPAAESAQVSAPLPQPQQVAVAPAGAESYAPLIQPVTGRMVSPDLPPLQGEDSFLPESAASFKGYMWPAKGLLTSGYGWRWGRMHAGIDIAADVGTPIFVAADGVVEYSDWNSGGYGNLIEVRHPDGSMTRYAHLNKSLVQAGQKVKQGEQIAEMGSTGYSTGPHLHFEVHTATDGGSVDPIAYLPQK